VNLLIISLTILVILMLGEQQANAQFLQVNLGIIQEIIGKIGDNLDDLFNTKPLDRFLGSGCLASDLTGETSVIKEKGHLIIGTDCDDEIKGDSEDEIIYTLKGNDRVWAGMGNDIIYGGMGSNRLYGERNDDIIIPGDGSNLIDGGPGDDVLFGALGNSMLIGGQDNDQFIAGAGTTIMNGGSGSNGFDCSGNSIVLDYNPDKGDTVAGKCKIVNNLGIDFSSDINLS
jgi:Ca2+-binding RTX toxin-like protein